MKIRVENIKKALDYVVVLMIFLMSKTVYFGIVNYWKTFYFFAAVSVVALLLNNGTIQKRNLKIFGIFIALDGFCTMCAVLIYKDMSAIMADSYILMVMLIVVIAVSTLTMERFFQCYTDIMLIVSIESLICYSFYFINQNIPRDLSLNLSNGSTSYIASWYHTWGINNVLYNRNPGPFWEPGAYQGFLIIALIIVFFRYKEVSHPKLKVIAYLVTLMSTASTTGYILTIILLVTMYNNFSAIFSLDKYKNISQGKKWIARFVALIGFIAVTAYVVASNNISNKLLIANDSSTIRTRDLVNGIAAAISNPFGVGIGSYRNVLEIQWNIRATSNGLLQMLYTYGIPFGLYYCYRTMRFIKDNISSGWKAFVLCIIVAICHMTEGYYWLAFFMVFLFEMKQNMPSEKNNSNNFLRGK